MNREPRAGYNDLLKIRLSNSFKQKKKTSVNYHQKFMYLIIACDLIWIMHHIIAKIYVKEESNKYDADNKLMLENILIRCMAFCVTSFALLYLRNNEEKLKDETIHFKFSAAALFIVLIKNLLCNDKYSGSVNTLEHAQSALLVCVILARKYWYHTIVFQILFILSVSKSLLKENDIVWSLLQNSKLREALFQMIIFGLTSWSLKLIFKARDAMMIYENERCQKLLKVLFNNLPDAVCLFSTEHTLQNKAFNKMININEDEEAIDKEIFEQKFIRLCQSFKSKENPTATLFEDIKTHFNDLNKKDLSRENVIIDKNEAKEYYTEEYVVITSLNFADFSAEISPRSIGSSSPPRYDSHIKSYLIRIITLKDLNNIMLVITDVTERRDLEEAKIADKYKTVLICSLSHEFRTPLNGIIGMLSLLRSGENLDREQKDIIQVAESSAQYFSNKVNDMLDFSQMESGNFELIKSRFKPEDLVADLYSIVVTYCKKQNVKLNFIIDNKIPYEIIADYDRTKQVLLNLLFNAIKYTPKGMVSLNLIWKPAQYDTTPNMGRIDFLSNKSKLKFEVIDTGIGMSKYQQQKIFQLFGSKYGPSAGLSPGNSPNKKASTLIGLGLTISNKICLHLGKKLKVSSKRGLGTKFWFSLKFDKNEVFDEDSADSEKRDLKHSTLNKGYLRLSPQRLNSGLPESEILKELKKTNSWRTKSISACPGPSNAQIRLKKVTRLLSSPQNKFSEEVKEIINTPAKKTILQSLFKDNSREFVFPRIILPTFSSPSADEEEIKRFRDESLIKELEENAQEEKTEEGLELSFYDKNSSYPNKREEYNVIRSKARAKITSSNRFSSVHVVQAAPYSSFNPSDLREFSLETETEEIPSEYMNEDNIDAPSRKISSMSYYQRSRVGSLSVQPSLLKKTSSPPLRKILDERNLRAMSIRRLCGCAQILSVDDNSINRFALHGLLSKKGYKIQEAVNGKEALDYLVFQGKKNCCGGIKVVFMDLQMPVMDGIEATERIKVEISKGTIRDLKIIAITAFATAEERKKCFSVGMDDFLMKPVNEMKLMECFKKYFVSG